MSDPDAAAPLDFDRLVRNLGADESAARRVLALFRDQVPRSLAALEQGLAEGDARAVERSAHQVKGALCWIAADDASQAAAALETLAREADLSAAGPSLARLRAAVDVVLAAIQRLD